MNKGFLSGHTVEVNMPSVVGYEQVAMECSATYARMLGFVKERIEDLKTAVSEAFLNAVEHGNKGRTDARIVVTIDYNDDIFSISIMDEGQDYVKLPEEPDIEKEIHHPQKSRGLGLYLIKRLVDHVEFNQSSIHGNTMRMLFHISQSHF